jgi:hypothetical protein
MDEGVTLFGEVFLSAPTINEGNDSTEPLDIYLDHNEVNLAKKASRAFAVTYVNEIYNTIKSMDPLALMNFRITKEYPYNLHIFIHQNEPKKIDLLEVYYQPKGMGDGLCEVKEIHHSSEEEDPEMDERKRCLAPNCITWKWSSLDMPSMYLKALCSAKRAGKSIYENSTFSPLSTKAETLQKLREGLLNSPHINADFWFNPVKH